MLDYYKVKIHFKWWGAFVALLLLIQPAFAGSEKESKAAISLRVAVCKRAMVYEKELYKKESIKMALLCDNMDKDYQDILQKEFNDDLIDIQPVLKKEFTDNAGRYDVVYYECSEHAEEFSELSKQHHLLSVTNLRQQVEDGMATLGVFFQDGKIRILINTSSAKAEKKEFFGDILSLSEMID